MKSFTPTCFWFMICSDYFPLPSYKPSSKCEIWQDFQTSLHNFQTTPFIVRLSKAVMKLVGAEEAKNPPFPLDINTYLDLFKAKIRYS